MLALTGAAILWTLGDRTPLALGGAVVAACGAAVVLLLGDRHPVLAAVIVFGLASAGRVVLETSAGTLRLEQPAIAASVLVAGVRIRREGFHVPRSVWVVASCLAVYLVVLATSSAVVAPQPISSLRMSLWWATSIAGGAALFVLLRGRAASARDAFVSVGAVFAAIGIAAATAFAIAGPDVSLGVQGENSVQPRVYGIGWEANLYASFLGASLLLGLGAFPTSRRLRLLAIILIAFALPLGGTRGAMLGFVTGLVVTLGIVGARLSAPSLGRLGPGLAAAGLAFALGWSSGDWLLPNNEERSATVGATPSPASPSASIEPGSASGPPGPLPTLIPVTDTIAFRLERIPPALVDLSVSPVIGLGAESFGQRHADPTQGGAPDHLAIMAVAVPYESGVVGSLALLVALVTIFRLLWAASRRREYLLQAATLAGATVSLLASFQATNAMHFATIWLILGLALATATETSQIRPDEAGIVTPNGGSRGTLPPFDERNDST